MWIRAFDNDVQRLVNISNAATLCVSQENSYGPWCIVAVFPGQHPNIPMNQTHIVIRRGHGTDPVTQQQMINELAAIEARMLEANLMYTC
jgi:hypothetical protein